MRDCNSAGGIRQNELRSQECGREMTQRKVIDGKPTVRFVFSWFQFRSSEAFCSVVAAAVPGGRTLLRSAAEDSGSYKRAVSTTNSTVRGFRDRSHREQSAFTEIKDHSGCNRPLLAAGNATT